MMTYDYHTESLHMSLHAYYYLATFVDEVIRRCDLPQSDEGYDLPSGWQTPEACYHIRDFLLGYLDTWKPYNGSVTADLMRETIRRLDQACGDVRE